MLLSQQNIKEILAKDGVEFEKPLLQALRSTMEKIKIKQLTEQVWNEIFRISDAVIQSEYQHPYFPDYSQRK